MRAERGSGDAGACASAAVPRPGVHDDLGWALATVLRAYVQASDEALAALPGGARGHRLLAAVVRDCPRTQVALAAHIGLDRTVVTYLVDDLAAAGLVERQPDPDDRRSRRVVATAAGQRRLVELDEQVGHVEHRLLADLSAEEVAALRCLLQRVAVGARSRSQSPVSCGEVAALAEG